jgi:radical SAM superfamily enzyme
MFNVILFTDAPYPHHKIRGYGVHRIASQIRANGYTCLVIDFSSALTFDRYKEIIDNSVGPETYMVGFSTTWLPYRYPEAPGEFTNQIPGHHIGKQHELSHDKEEKHNWRKDNLVVKFGLNQVDEWLQYPKTINPKVKIVLGGAKADFYMDLQNVDHVIFGIAETMTIELLDKLSGKTKRIFNKYIDHDRKAHAPTWDFRESSTSYTENDFIQSMETLTLEVGRGCRFKCAFCNFPLIGQKNVNDYLKYPDKIRDELVENYERWGTTKYFIVDDTFNDSTEKLEMMVKVMRDLPFKIKFWCYTRIDLLATHPEQIELMKELGVAETFFGLETFNDKSSKTIGKGMPSSRRKDTLYRAKEVWGDRVWMEGGFMIGLPHETQASWRETVEWLKREDCPLDISTVYPLNIVKKTDRNQWFPTSWFDNNYEEFGYSFPRDGIEGLLYWEKNDGSDIFNFDQAQDMAHETTKELKDYQRSRRGDFYTSSFNHPLLCDRERTLDLTQEQYHNIIKDIDFENLFYEHTNRDYFIPLLKKLRGKDV